ncbi:unnamed protein product [Phytophthora lilii]|uniref:Unnamed protein product n=1 Tax=Phytophthora lilii TaxID=2077276 RepID=A0A9W6TT99_9STRA|nr:unnamed protein product [Phytophthora lilii]
MPSRSADSTALTHGALLVCHVGTREGCQCYANSRHIAAHAPEVIELVVAPPPPNPKSLGSCSLTNSRSRRDVRHHKMSRRPAGSNDNALQQPELRPVGVPLSPGCFRATAAERRGYAALVRGRVDSLLKDEARYAQRHARQQPFLHAGEWKQVKREKDLTFYRRLTRGRSLRELALEEELPEVRRAVERGYTSMICDGHIQGTIEDMMYGMTASSQDDLLTGFSYRNPPKDCVWLGSVETATREDPFHTADLIWALPKLPPVVDQVDMCYLKATGVELDENNKTYGYLVLHGVHIAQCPPFAAHGISRAKMYFACLFREPQPGILKVTVRGIFDMSKKVRMLKGLGSAATTSVMIGLLNGVGIGEAKKLTLLTRRKDTAHRNLANSPKQSVCYMCSNRASFLGRARIFGMHLVTCGVCGGTVCSNCTHGTKRRVFLGAEQPCSKIDCCPNCVREAVTTIHVRPAEPEFQVVADFYLLQQATSLPKSPSHNGGMITTTSSGMPTASSTDESVAEYQLDFEDDPFSIALTLPEVRRSSGDDENAGTNNEPEPSPEAAAGSSEITVWEGGRHRISVDGDDFIPLTAADRLQTDRMYANARLAKDIERRLLELNIQAECTYAQTQETSMIMHQGERR